MTDVDGLVQRAQANDKMAFGELYELFAPKIYSYLVYHLNGRVDAAEDLTAEVFMKALQNLSTFEFRDVPFSAWLYRIAHNRLIDHVRSERKHQTVVLDDVPHLLIERDALAGRLDRHVLAAALSHITEQQREVVLLRVVQGLSIAETAAVLDKTEDAIKQLNGRGLRALKRVLEAEPPLALSCRLSGRRMRCEPPFPARIATGRQPHRRAYALAAA